MSASHEPSDTRDTHPFHLVMLLGGGLTLGTGLINLYYSFGWTGGDFNSNFELVGFSGLDEIGLLSTSTLSIPLVVVGALMLVVANATAWKETGGY